MVSRNYDLWHRSTIDEGAGSRVVRGNRTEVKTWSNQTPIPKISSSWKIFVAAHTLTYMSHTHAKLLIRVKMTAKDTSSAVTIKVFSGSPRALFKTGEGGTTTVDLMYPLEGISRHKIELIHQEEGDNYSLSVFVDNMEVGKTSCSSLLLSNLTDVRITWGEGQGILRDLGVLHK